MWSIWTINNHFAGPGRVERVAHSFMNKLEVEQVFVPSVTSIENSLIHYVGLIEILTTLNTVPTWFLVFDRAIYTVKIWKNHRKLQEKLWIKPFNVRKLIVSHIMTVYCISWLYICMQILKCHSHCEIQQCTVRYSELVRLHSLSDVCV